MKASKLRYELKKNGSSYISCGMVSRTEDERLVWAAKTDPPTEFGRLPCHEPIFPRLVFSNIHGRAESGAITRMHC